MRDWDTSEVIRVSTAYPENEIDIIPVRGIQPEMMFFYGAPVIEQVREQ